MHTLGDVELPRADRAPEVQRDTGRWAADLSVHGARRDAAMRRLHDLLERVARGEALRRSSAIGGRELDDLIQQAVDDALLAIISKLSQFRGESLFTTWASKFVILEISSKLARHAWRRSAPGDGSDLSTLPDRFGFDPQEAAQHADLLGALRDAVMRELTDRQREVFVAIVVDAEPLDALAARLRSNRNALYKTLFDARRKLRAALIASGHLRGEDI